MPLDMTDMTRDVMLFLNCMASTVGSKDKKGEQPAKIRLYSIASSAVGDDQSSNTVSLCASAARDED